MDKLIRLALNHRPLVIALAALVVAYGAWVLHELPIDVFPDLNRPVVTILTECDGMAPEEVEALVTLPLETGMNGMPGVERVRSVSGVTLSIIYVEFSWGTDVYRNRQLVAERLSMLRNKLPKGAEPVIGPVTSLMGETQLVGIVAESDSMSPMELRTYADWIVRPRLQAVPGVAQVIAIGGDVKQYQILISAEKVKFNQLKLEELEHSLGSVSENTTGGFLNKDSEEYLIRNIGAVESIADIENSMVAYHLGRPVLVKDIATVKLGPAVKRGDGSINAKDAVILAIHKQPNVNTVVLTERVNEAIAELEESVPEGMRLEKDLFKQSHFIDTSIRNVKEVLRDGVVLVSIILFLFLLNFRTTVISLTAIPLSFVLSFIIFRMLDLTVNTMTLGGLAIAIGELVDDAIVDVENVFRRLRENRKRSNPLPSLQVVYQASKEIRGSIVFATLIVVLVFVPLFRLTGLEGRLFIPLGLAYIISLSASLLVSLTVTPVLCSYLLPKAKAVEEENSRFVQFLQGLQQRLLRPALQHPYATLSLAASLVVAAASTAPFLGTSFLPTFQESTAMISVIATPGISLEASNKLGRQAEEIMLAIPEVKSVSRRTGRAEEDEHAEGVHTSEIDVDFHPGGRNRHVVLADMRERLRAALPGVNLNVGQPLAHKIDHMMSGINSQIAIKIFGPDLGVLRRKAAEVEKAIADVKGVVDLQVEAQTRIPQSKIYLLRKEAAAAGIVLGELATSLQMALNGIKVAQVIQDQRYTDVVMRLDDQSRRNLDLIAELPVHIQPNGQRIHLYEVADVYDTKGPNLILRENAKRRIAIQANAAGRDIGSIIKDVRKRIEGSVELPAGYYVEYDGQYESQRRASQAISWMGVGSLLAIFTILLSYFGSAWLATQVMISIPLASAGGLVAVWLMGGDLSIASLIGFITLCGIASRNAIMMLSHFLHLMREEGESFSQAMVLRGAKERLIPVLMTSITAILGLVPLAIAAGDPGKEILHPLSVVIIGGLLSSTLFDILVTPTLFFHFGRRAAERSLQLKEKV